MDYPHLVAYQASSSQLVEVEAPQELARAPFDWSHANLEPLREMLLLAKQQGIFSPQPDLPLWGWTNKISQLCWIFALYLMTNSNSPIILLRGLASGKESFIWPAGGRSEFSVSCCTVAYNCASTIKASETMKVYLWSGHIDWGVHLELKNIYRIILILSLMKGFPNKIVASLCQHSLQSWVRGMPN